VTSSTTRTASTASATGPGRRRFAPGVGSGRPNSRERDTWQKSAIQVAEVGQAGREERLADLRRNLKAPAWAAAVGALQQEGGDR
jgi:hypothetical protein